MNDILINSWQLNQYYLPQSQTLQIVAIAIALLGRDLKITVHKKIPLPTLMVYHAYLKKYIMDENDPYKLSE